MEWLTVNHTNKIKHLKEEKALRYEFTPEETHMVWKNIDPRFKPYYQLMNETGLCACDMWDLTKDNFPVSKHGMELHVQQNKTEDLVKVPVTTKAATIVNSLDFRLFPWTDKVWAKENGLKLDQRTLCLNALYRSFCRRKTRGYLERGKKYCEPNNIR